MDTTTRLARLSAFADLVQRETEARYRSETPKDVDANVHSRYWQVSVKPGKKYTKVDVGPSGKYMVDAHGQIFGIKAYGVIHFGHQYGTLDTINEWNWGDYTAVKRKVVTV